MYLCHDYRMYVSLFHVCDNACLNVDIERVNCIIIILYIDAID